LTVSRAAILASVLPQWSPEWPANLLEAFPDQKSYQTWFTRFLGILDDPVAARKLIDNEKSSGERTPGNKYGYPRAFTRNPAREELEILYDLLRFAWGTPTLAVLDPFAGGGSIPFEALRYGFTTYANELNPVAAFILKGTLDYPARFGPSLADDIRKWGQRWYELAQPRLEPYFAAPSGMPTRSIYMWARTVPCPGTGKPVPLAPNWWIRRGSDPIAVRLVVHPSWNEPRFEVARGDGIDFDPDEGTLSRGAARSPWTNEVVESDYIKREAQAGRMGDILYCIEVQTASGKDYVAPTEHDREVFQEAERALREKRVEWMGRNVVPNEPFPSGNDNRPLLYGMPIWSDFFSPRQLLAMGTFVETLRELEGELRGTVDQSRAQAIIAYCGLILNKCPNYNCRLSSWHASRGVIRSVFDRHDFSFKWTFVEFNASYSLFPWALDQIVDAYRGISDLVAPAQMSLGVKIERSVDRLDIQRGGAASLPLVPDGTIHNITVDPPYYDNVQYAELSDFFYVWLKRSVGHLFPEFFGDELTNKDDEAVANPARFAAMGRKRQQLAEQDYERKMAAAFREMHRVLHPDGVLTVMFTHKRVEAWDTLATALIGEGFAIRASWPVHTESEHSLHQAKKNAAASTILLVCRKRDDGRRTTDDGGGAAVWWDDLQGRVREVAREKAREYAAQGIGGVDLYISTFGPTLSVISEHWPVLTSEIDERTGQPRPLRPETALDLAREEVIRLRKEGLLAGKAIEFDPVTDWYLMAWDAFQAEQFPYDEARKLAIALGLEVEELMGAKRLVRKQGQYVVLQRPEQRRKRGMVDPDATFFEHWIDALHTAMMVYAEDGAGACDAFLMGRGLKRDTTFRAGLQALINAIPRARVKGKFVRPEADVLDRMRLAFYADELTVPPEEEPEAPRPEQLELL
ncbi:MAG: DUF1156 domain-containing protein, partial [Anaerolineae bacterium]|nr:DUF1156 domain-containing protein [Anaerolineae bacterium]